MLTAIRRAATTATLTCIPLALIASAAFGDGQSPNPVPVGGGSGGSGTITCPPNGGDCQITVSTTGTPGSSSSPAPSTGGGSGSSGGGSGTASTASPEPTLVNGACTYAPDPTYVPLPGSSDVHTGQKGAWYVMTCPDGIKAGTNIATTTSTEVWLATPPPPAAAKPTPAQLAAQARNSLRLSKPAIAFNPGVGHPQMVGIPMWAWIESGMWSPVSASASVPGESVTATATPESVSWDFGDGSSTTCYGPGTPYQSGSNPLAASPDCGHTYRTASGGSKGGAFQVTATITWRVSWLGVGQAGVFNGLTTTSAVQVTVQQSQALVTGTG